MAVQLADALALNGALERAEPLLRRAGRILCARFGLDSVSAQKWFSRLVWCLSSQGGHKLASAAEACCSRLRALHQTLPEDASAIHKHEALDDVLKDLALLQEAQGHMPEALDVHKTREKLCALAREKDDPTVLLRMWDVAVVANDAGLHEAAEQKLWHLKQKVENNPEIVMPESLSIDKIDAEYQDLPLQVKQQAQAQRHIGEAKKALHKGCLLM